MELRVLRYFLMVAREGSITKAANLLHITQPTLSRQMIQLEEELGVSLFLRNKYRITLTDDGILLKHRAQEIIELADKTEEEFKNKNEELNGKVSIGCGETKNMSFLSQNMANFRKKYPLVRYNIYSATADEIKDLMEKGILDLGLLMEPVDISRYEFIRMPHREQWGLLVRTDSPLAQKEADTQKDLVGVPLISAKRELVQHELANWMGDYYEKMEFAATYNLIMNAANMVLNGVGAAFGFRLEATYENLKFLPLSPGLETGAVLAWKKNQIFSDTVSAFIQFLRHSGQEV